MRIEKIQTILSNLLRDTASDAKKLPGTRRLDLNDVTLSPANAANMARARLAALEKALMTGEDISIPADLGVEAKEGIEKSTVHFHKSTVSSQSLDEINKKVQVGAGRSWEASRELESPEVRHPDNKFIEGYDKNNAPIFAPEDFKARPFQPSQEDYEMAMLIMDRVKYEFPHEDFGAAAEKGRSPDYSELKSRIVSIVVGASILLLVMMTVI